MDNDSADFGQKLDGSIMDAPFDNRAGKIWFDGALIPWEEAQIHVLSHGLHYASAVFEGERAYNGEIFKLREHTERLFASAALLSMEMPYSPDEVDEACRMVVASHGLSEAYVRPIAWRGSEMMGVSAQHTKIHFAVAAWEWPSYFDPEERMRGLKLDIAEWRRPSPETIPCQSKATGLYMICTLARHAAEAKGYADALMLDYRGLVAETTGANIFFRDQDNVLHTPTPDCFLDGITRRTVMDLARRRGVKIIERAIKPEEMKNFVECFITGTAAEVTAVAEIGAYRFVPGTLTQQLMDDYINLVNRKQAA